MAAFFRSRGNGSRDSATSDSDNPEPLYSLRPAERPLIEAAIGLGDWILEQSGASRRQKKAVLALQEALRGLPGTPAPIIAEYGFHFRVDPPAGKGLYRAWRVALSPSGIEIYSVYSPDEKIEFEDKIARELNFWQRPSKPASHDGYYYEEWIDEVSDPDRFRQAGATFGFMAEYERGEY